LKAGDYFVEVVGGIAVETQKVAGHAVVLEPGPLSAVKAAQVPGAPEPRHLDACPEQANVLCWWKESVLTPAKVGEEEDGDSAQGGGGMLQAIECSQLEVAA